MDSRIIERIPWRDFLYLLLLLVTLGATSSAHARQPLELLESVGHYPLTSQLEYLEDPNGKLQLGDVFDSDAFLPPLRGIPNFGFTRSTYWFRIPLTRSSDSTETWLIEIGYPPLDDIALYLTDRQGRTLYEARGGDAHPFATWPIEHHHFTVPLPIPGNEQSWLYLRVQTEGSLQLPATIWSDVNFIESMRGAQHLLGLYYGILLSMLLYNLLLYTSIRDSTYLYYVLYIGAYALFQLSLNGLAFEYLWPNATAWANRAVPFFIAAAMLGMIKLARSFLQTATQLPRADKVLRVCNTAFAVLAVFSLFAPYNWAIIPATASAVIIPIIVFAISGKMLLRGHRPARYFLAAFGVLLLGVLLYGLKTFHALPTNLVTEHALQIGSALEMILLSLALGDRLKVMREEQERMEREAKLMLEARVAERTAELHHALVELESANLTLKERNTIDGLTGARNRQFLDDTLEAEWRRAHRDQTPLSVLLLDIDYFKDVNDNYGHQCGDVALQRVAATIEGLLHRAGDTLGRYGGEEFMVILPNTSLEGARALAEKIRQQISRLSLEHNGENFSLTVSIGAASIVPDAPASPEALAELIGSADAALYRGKSRGRNRVELAS